MTVSHRRRSALAAAGALLATAAAPRLARASTRTVRILVGFPPGGGTDAIARMLGEKLKDELGANVVVENRPGAGGQIAAQALKAASPDGNTVFLSHDHSISILPLTMKSPGFDPATDFVPVAGFATFVNALALSPWTRQRDYRTWVTAIQRQQGGKGAVGIPAPASVPEFLVKAIAAHHKLDLVAPPYRGSAPMIQDMLGNQIPAGVGSVPDFIEYHRQGQLRIVATIGAKRDPQLPEVPTFAELGVAGFEDEPFYGVWAPAATPKPAVEALSAAIAKVIAQPELRDKLTALGLRVRHIPGPELATLERNYSRAWAQIIRKSGYVPQ